MANRTFSIFALFLMLGSAVAAAPPAPVQTTFTPEVAYRYKGRDYIDIRLSDAAGTAAVLVNHSARLNGFDLGPASQRIVAYIEGGVTNSLFVRTWSIDAPTGAITVSPPRLLRTSRNLFFPDFSPAGDKLSFVEYVGPGSLDMSLNTVDLATGAITIVAPSVYMPADMRWAATGDAFYYHSQITENGVLRHDAYRHPISGEPRQLIFSEPNIHEWDIARDGTDRLVFPFARPTYNDPFKFGMWDGAAVSYLGTLGGTQPHYSCGNDRLIYRSYGKNGSNGAVRVHTFATGSDVPFTKDLNIASADFLACG